MREIQLNAAGVAAILSFEFLDALAGSAVSLSKGDFFVKSAAEHPPASQYFCAVGVSAAEKGTLQGRVEKLWPDPSLSYDPN